MIKILKRSFCTAIILSFALISTAQVTPRIFPSTYKSNTAQRSNPVDDNEKLFTANENTTLLNTLTDFEMSSGIRIAVVTIDTTMVTKANFDDYTLLLANSRNLSNEFRKPGILIGISQGHRLIRIQNSDEIEKLISDEETADIMNKFFIANFKSKLYYRGTIDGVQELIKLLRIKLKEQGKNFN